MDAAERAKREFESGSGHVSTEVTRNQEGDDGWRPVATPIRDFVRARGLDGSIDRGVRSTPRGREVEGGSERAGPLGGGRSGRNAPGRAPVASPEIECRHSRWREQPPGTPESGRFFLPAGFRVVSRDPGRLLLARFFGDRQRIPGYFSEIRLLPDRCVRHTGGSTRCAIASRGLSSERGIFEPENQPAPTQRDRDLIAIHPLQRAEGGRMRRMGGPDDRASLPRTMGPPS